MIEAIQVVGTALLTATGVSLYQRYSSDSDGCSEHHWGEYTTDYGQMRIEYSHDYLTLHPTETAQCQHDGCYVTDTQKATSLYVPINATVQDLGTAEDVRMAVEEMKEDNE